MHPLHGPCFVCEGRFLVESALEAHFNGNLEVVSILGTPQAIAHLEERHSAGLGTIQLLPVGKSELEAWVGFAFHRGLMCMVKCPPEKPIEQLAAARRLVVLPHVDNVDNLGLVLRTACALGMDGLLVGQGPGLYDRRTVRVSMGALWRMPAWQREDVAECLELWKAGGGEVVGAALVEGAQDARNWQASERTALMLGPEAYGLTPEWLARCDRHLVIPMHNAMDSLNLAAAGAILMFKMMGEK